MENRKDSIKQQRSQVTSGLQCYVSNCFTYRNPTSREQGVTFHKFPDKEKKPELYNVWVKNCGRDTEPTHNARVCSKHFDLDSFYRSLARTRVKEDAVPTIFKTPMLKKPSKNPRNHTGIGKSKRTRKRKERRLAFPYRGTKCFASDCPNYTNDLTKCQGILFHKFPDKEKEPEKYQVWVRYCRRSTEPSVHSTVCSIHFDEKYFNRTRAKGLLTESAVPTKCNLQSIPPATSASTMLSPFSDNSSAQETISDNHLFDVYSQPDLVKQRIHYLEFQNKRLQTQLQLSKVNEKRAKDTFVSLIQELQDKNLFTAELQVKLQSHDSDLIYKNQDIRLNEVLVQQISPKKDDRVDFDYELSLKTETSCDDMITVKEENLDSESDFENEYLSIQSSSSPSNIFNQSQNQNIETPDEQCQFNTTKQECDIIDKDSNILNKECEKNIEKITSTSLNKHSEEPKHTNSGADQCVLPMRKIERQEINHKDLKSNNTVETKSLSMAVWTGLV